MEPSFFHVNVEFTFQLASSSRGGVFVLTLFGKYMKIVNLQLLNIKTNKKRAWTFDITSHFKLLSLGVRICFI